MPAFSAEELERDVQDCLTQFYDFAFLQKHPLVDVLLPDAKGPNRIQLFRNQIIETIESLRTSPELGENARSERLYNILNLRYIKKHPVQRVLSALALSERQFYRDHTKAVQTLTGLLWEQITGEERPTVEGALEDTGSVETEVQRTRGEPKQTRTEFQALLDGVLAAAQPMLAEHGVTVDTVIADTLTILDSDRTATRQIVLLILSELALQAPGSGSALEISAQSSPAWIETTFRLRAAPGEPIEAMVQKIDGQESLQQLVRSIQGEVSAVPSETGGTVSVHLRLPLRHDVILVIDDNPNIIQLFRRYVSTLPYQVVGADMYESAIQLARTLQPRFVILDVMLSGQDGWEILQDLKSHPTTRVIPVLICSVLDIASLATSLGADGFIRKPPGLAEFVTILQQS